MFAAYSLPSIFGSLICGEILSKYGRRIILFFSILVMAISTITFSYVNDLSSKETIIYFICGIRAIEGLSAGFIYCAVYSIIQCLIINSQCAIYTIKFV